MNTNYTKKIYICHKRASVCDNSSCTKSTSQICQLLQRMAPCNIIMRP